MRSLVCGLAAAMLAFGAPRSAVAAGSCYDGEQNEPESDVDCGGDCPLCAVGRTCHVARDCESGLCNAGRCEERSWTPGDPLPAGYHVETSTHDRAATARLGGAWFFGVGYGAAYLSALILPNKLSVMYVPAVGPWLALKNADPGAPKTLVVADGVVQDVGAVLLIGGLIGAGQQVLRQREPTARFDIMPLVSSRACALDVIGVF